VHTGALGASLPLKECGASEGDLTDEDLMTKLMIARFNSGRADETFAPRFGSEKLDTVTAGDLGVDRETRYRALALTGRYWTYRPDPEFTIVLELSKDTDEPTVLLDRWGSEWGSVAHDTAICSRNQIVGRDDSLAYSRVLIAQMNVAPPREQEFHDWYNDEHIPQAGQIPGFGTDHRRYQLENDYSGGAPGVQRFMAMYEILADADLEAAINSDEYRDWSGDFLARWRDDTTDEVSTICERVS
jgi:hypothetical protein